MITGAGVRDLDSQLCAEIERLASAARRDPALLALPVRIVVPSDSLRVHVQSLLVRSAPHAVVGVSVQSLANLARSIAAEAAEAARPSGTFSVLCRRLAREEACLAQPLDAFADAYSVVEATLADLLDAGFDGSLVDALDACLAEVPLARAEHARVRALIRIAARAERALESDAFDHTSGVMRRAREHVASASTAALPTRALIVHGFSDATGVQTDLLEILVRTFDARVLIGRPPDPARDAAISPGSAFGARFRERIAAACSEPALAAPASAAAPRIALLGAPDPGAEARAVAERVRALLDRGALPERIAVVARALGDHTLALRTHFTRLAIPFSGWKARGPATAAGRQQAALQELLAQGPDAPVERWLDALVAIPIAAGRQTQGDPHHVLSHAQRSDLRHAFHERGVARVADLADWKPEATRNESGEPADAVDEANGSFKLSVLQGLAAGEGDGPARAQSRRLSRAWVGAAAHAARAFAERCKAWPARAQYSAHCEWLLEMLREDFGWSEQTPGSKELHGALLPDVQAIPAGFELEREEFLLALRRALDGAGRVALGGAGGGVQVLDVMEARARSFEHLFVIGMQRGAFPRVIGQDPLLSDDLRRSLRAVLPDLPVKAEGADEERHLFAQLASASADVTFSFHSSDASGSPRSASPLLERLKSGERAPEILDVAPLLSARAWDAQAGLHIPAHESALRVGLSGSRQDFQHALALALEESCESRDAAQSLAVSRAAVLNELDPPASLRAAPGPYLGFVGAATDRGDPRRGPLYITAVERMARCPWQTFLARVLRAEPGPDALDALPSASDALAIGRVVHTALESIFGPALVGDPAHDVALAERPGFEVAWPSRAELDAIVLRCAKKETRAQGIALAGYEHVLALRVRPYLEVARSCWVADVAAGARTIAVEADSCVAVRDASGALRKIHFKADRVDRVGDALSFTDYKTGKPAVAAVKADTRADKLRESVRSGSALQAFAYALSEPAGATGRYLYLDPALDQRTRVLASDEAEDLSQDFEGTVATVLAAWDCGSFPPRLRAVDEDREPDACQRCDVKEACLRGDSGVRRRLGDWMDATAEDAVAGAEREAIRIWKLAGVGS